MVQLSDTTLAVDGTFSLLAISQSYTHLLIVAQIRLTNATTSDSLVMRFNNDSAARYGSQYVRGLQAAASAAEITTTATPTIALVTANSAAAGFATALEILIPNYTGTTFNKQAVCKSMVGAGLTTGLMPVETAGITYNQTAAVTRIDLFGLSTANCLAGSRVSLYGIL